VQLPWSRTLTGALTAGGQLASYWPTQNGRRNVTREATFFLDRQLSAPCDAFVEYAADFPQTGGSRQILHVGTAYKLAAHHQVDFHVAAGLSAAAPRSFVVSDTRTCFFGADRPPRRQKKAPTRGL